MVGHFLQPNRKSRSNSGSTSSSSASSNPHVAPPSSAAVASASVSTYNPPSAMASPPPSRYASASTAFDVPTMPFMPPQNLTAEAVAALPPPGTSSGMNWTTKTVKRSSQSVILCVCVPQPLYPLLPSLYRSLGSFCNRIQSQGYAQGWKVQVSSLCVYVIETTLFLHKSTSSKFGRGLCVGCRGV
jgi:hypothetical protein